MTVFGVTLPRAVVRNLLIALVVVDLVVLLGFSVRVRSTTTTTTTVPAAATVGFDTPQALPTVPVVPIDGGTALGTGGVPISDVTTTPTKPVKPAKTPTATATPTSGPTLPNGNVRVAACPIAIAPSTTDGGLQSLIDFAPAFGPFSAEAFAAASAYQPLLQLIGPILAKYPQFAPQLQPLVSPLVGTLQDLLNQGFAILGPLYTPYRQQFLEAETKLAAGLAPLAQQLTASPLGGCVIALQNALLTDGSLSGAS